ncbi:MAG: tetratricopeptide repeat protein, partial [Candidatus Neomarinimicrobiota bacterium]
VGESVSAGGAFPAAPEGTIGAQEETKKKRRPRPRPPSAAADSTKKGTVSKGTRKRRPSGKKPRPRRPRRRPKSGLKTYTETELRSMTSEITSLNKEITALNRRTARRLASLVPAGTIPMGQRYRFDGELDRIQELERRAVENPGDAAILVALADIQARNYKHEAAEEYLQRALALEPLNQELLFDLGWLYLDAGKPTRAWTTFQEIIYLNPESYAGRLAQGEVREAEGDYAGARAIYRQVEERFGPLAEGYYHQSVNYILRGNYGEAVALARTGLEMFPDDATLFYARGEAYAGLGMLDRAKTDLYDALSLDVNYYDVFPALGEVSSQEGNYSTAIRVYLRYLDEYPGDPDLSFALGQAYLWDLRFGDAVREWEMLLYLHGPDDQVEAWLPRAFYLESLDLKRQGRFQAALEAHGRATSLSGGNTADWLVPALVGAGEGARLQGQFTRSVDYFTKALEMDPFAIDTYVGLSLTYAAIGDTIQARSTLRHALNLDAGHPRARVVQQRLNLP